MKNVFGQSVILTIAGESHGPAITAVLSGVAPGIKISHQEIEVQLAKRRPKSDLSTSRREPDDFEILSGITDGVTTGAPITIVIKNKDVDSTEYLKHKNIPRPGHADFAAEFKFHGFQDVRGGGMFSGRITAAVVAAGAILLKALAQKNIFIGTHILECGGVKAHHFENISEDMIKLSENDFPVFDIEAGEKMKAAIALARDEKDSIGGVTETAIIGVPAGVGEPFFDSTESVLSHLMFSIPAIKGVAFGAGYDFAEMKGSESNDTFAVENHRIVTTTNHNGGINGGITNGNPILFRCVVKPTPSIGKPQQTVDMKTLEPKELCLSGRHDPCILPRIPVVIDSIAALGICDLLALRYGTDYFIKV